MASQLKEDIHLATRIFCFLSLSFDFVFFAIYDLELIFFAYFTHWGLFWTSIYFLVSLLSYKVNVHTLQFHLFLTIWVFNWNITSAYWGYLFPRIGTTTPFRSIVNHILPLLFTLIELAQVRFTVKRSNFLIPLIALLCYLSFVLIPVTINVKEIYCGITFKNYKSYFICLSMLIFGFILLEVIRFLFDLKNKKRTIANEEMLIQKP